MGGRGEWGGKRNGIGSWVEDSSGGGSGMEWTTVRKMHFSSTGMQGMCCSADPAPVPLLS